MFATGYCAVLRQLAPVAVETLDRLRRIIHCSLFLIYIYNFISPSQHGSIIVIKKKK